MIDFTIKTFIRLISTLQDCGHPFCTFEQYLTLKQEKFLILRHDVDDLKENALDLALIEHEYGIKGTFNFRIVPESFDEDIIVKIHDLGHEIGYHYEDVSFAARKRKTQSLRKGMLVKEAGLSDYGSQEKELADMAIQSFSKNLQKLRDIVPIKTICMHGSPTSKWDSRLLWNYYDYRNFGLIGEPYFDVDFNNVLYLTDTGRCWDGDSFNVRDKAYQIPHPVYKPPLFHSTFDMIKVAGAGGLADKIMITIHPQRWSNNPFLWAREYFWQNIKNSGKYFLIQLRD